MRLLIENYCHRGRISTATSPTALLQPGEPPAFEIVNIGGASNALLICDPTSNRAPHSQRNFFLNRLLQSPDLTVEQSAGLTIHGNNNLSLADRQLRIDSLFIPYHQTIETLLDQGQTKTNFLLRIHSFTPELNAQRRPRHIGFSHKRDTRFQLFF